MFWNEKNFPFDDFIFAQGAYEAKRYMYVSDVVRLWALQKYGGIYVDTDVEILRPLDEFLEHGFFGGFESFCRLQTGLMGAKKGHPYTTLFLDWYRGRRFTTYDINPNTRIISKITSLIYHCKLQDNGTPLQLPGDVCFYPQEYFFPHGHVSEHTYCIHYTKGCGFDATGKSF